MTSSGGSLGLGIVVFGVGLLMVAGASLSLRSIWGRSQQQQQDLPRSGPLPLEGKPLRSPGVGEMRTPFRILISFDFGCLVLISAVLLFLGLVLILRAVA